MDRSLLCGSRRLLQVLALCLLLTLATVPPTSCQSLGELESECKLEKTTVEVHYPGCEPTTTTIPVCNGACLSGVRSILQPPFQQLTCNSCRAIQYRTKPKRLTFVCDGVEFVHRVYYPFAEDCGCVDCSAQL